MCGADTVASQSTAMDDITWLQAHTNYTYSGTNVTKVFISIVVDFLSKLLLFFVVTKQRTNRSMLFIGLENQI